MNDDAKRHEIFDRWVGEASELLQDLAAMPRNELDDLLSQTSDRPRGVRIKTSMTALEGFIFDRINKDHDLGNPLYLGIELNGADKLIVMAAPLAGNVGATQQSLDLPKSLRRFQPISTLPRTPLKNRIKERLGSILDP